MKRFASCVLALIVAALAGAAWAEQPLSLELTLKDGSRIIGVPVIESVPVETSYAKMDLSLRQIVALEMGADQETVTFDLRNGDRLKGVVALEALSLETAFGKVSINLGHLQRLRVRSAGRALPGGEGALAFGGLHWMAWRTAFEVQGDKLVALPKARPGFNYGHDGNGRSSWLVSNVGNPDWKDYTVEFEYCMSGVDPAFNPCGLPLDYRSGQIMFHVADAKESWNERGASMYTLSLGCDGFGSAPRFMRWRLAGYYNAYCRAPAGCSAWQSDDERRLAEGQGLELDPKTGNKFRIDVCGTRIQIWVDGSQIADVRDEKMAESIGGQTLDHGGIGFNWQAECMGWIRNLSAKQL